MTRTRLTRLLAVLTVGCLSIVGCSRTSAACDPDALVGRAVTDLESFTAWLEEHEQLGAVTEVGWPGGADSAAWTDLAATWLDQAQAAGLQVFVWGAAPWWPADERLAVYRAEPGSTTLSIAGPQAALVDSSLRDGLPGGVAMAEGSFGADLGPSGTYAAGRAGVYGYDYTYPDAASYEFLADRGVHDVRLAVMWERLQPVLGGQLDPVELDRLRTSLEAAAAAGVYVVIDLHSYGRYALDVDGVRTVLALGSDELPIGLLADFWGRLAGAVEDLPAVSGFELMNEPHGLPGGAPTWEAASLAAAEAIRATGSQAAILVGGYDWSSVGQFAAHHPEPWIPGDLDPVIYAVHQYFDVEHRGVYDRSYADTEEQVAALAGCS